MEFEQQIQRFKAKILKEWYESIIGSFPQKSRRLIGLNEDRFQNPMGFTLYEGIRTILETVVNKLPVEGLEEALGQIIKIKAIQEKQPADGLDFLFDLKKIIRSNCDVLAEDFSENKALFELEDLIDSIILKAHIIFVESREKISELKVEEMAKKTYMLKRVAGVS